MNTLSLKNSAKPQLKKQTGIVKILITKLICFFSPKVRQKIASAVIDKRIDEAMSDHINAIVDTGIKKGFEDSKGGAPTNRAVIRRMPLGESFSQRLARQTREKNLKKNQ